MLHIIRSTNTITKRSDRLHSHSTLFTWLYMYSSPTLMAWIILDWVSTVREHYFELVTNSYFWVPNSHYSNKIFVFHLHCNIAYFLMPFFFIFLCCFFLVSFSMYFQKDDLFMTRAMLSGSCLNAAS